MDESGFGRPEDKSIEKEFMKKIRGDKLQTINAECELEICLAFREEKPSKGKRRNSKPKSSDDENSVNENQVPSLTIGQLNPDRREHLIHLFKQFRNKWEFEEIKENEPLPEFFFDDGNDLSYILFNINQTEPTKFKAEELIFLELLCLEGRNHLTQNILEEYKENMDYMLEAMKIGLIKIQEKKKLYENQKIKGKERKTSQEELVSSIQETQNNMMGNELEHSKIMKKEVSQKKTKAIKKPKKKRKTKQKTSSENESQDEGGQSAIYPKGKELVLKTCNYISWAYWYIIPK